MNGDLYLGIWENKGGITATITRSEDGSFRVRLQAAAFWRNLLIPSLKGEVFQFGDQGELRSKAAEIYFDFIEPFEPGYELRICGEMGSQWDGWEDVWGPLWIRDWGGNCFRRR